ncbi:MAG: hypothetical protein JWN67_2715 [Actinomycetia bacterium]|nr:hypothetical protein [Actinomycetes bacterium]
MPEIQPPELAALLDFAERPRTEGWSLRAALTRYAQGQPRRVGDLLQLVRRIQAALGGETGTLDRDGPELWQQLTSGADGDGLVPGLLRAARAIDEVGDTLATWAADPWKAERPDDAVDAVLATVAVLLDELGVPVEERPARPPGGRRRG